MPGKDRKHGYSTVGARLRWYDIPDARVMPVQFFSAAQSARGELALMGALIEDAVYSLATYAHRHSRRDRRLFDEAMAWLTSDDTDYPFSFVNCCLHLNC